MDGERTVDLLNILKENLNNLDLGIAIPSLSCFLLSLYTDILQSSTEASNAR
jgi:hypothetical protein